VGLPPEGGYIFQHYDVRTSVACIDARYADAAKFCALEMPIPPKRTEKQACIHALPVKLQFVALESDRRSSLSNSGNSAQPKHGAERRRNMSFGMAKA